MGAHEVGPDQQPAPACTIAGATRLASRRSRATRQPNHDAGSVTAATSGVAMTAQASPSTPSASSSTIASSITLAP